MRHIPTRVRVFFTGLWAKLRRIPSAPSADVVAFLDDLFDRFPFSPAAVGWMRDHVSVEMRDLDSVHGGGLFYPGQNRVVLNTGQYEAAIHELAHAWWDTRRMDEHRDFVEAVVRAADDGDPGFARIGNLARGYVYGLAEQGFPGFLRDGNDWEMFAGLASGCMADIRLLPPYLRVFFEDLFDLLPLDAARPERMAPHR